MRKLACVMVIVLATAVVNGGRLPPSPNAAIIIGINVRNGDFRSK